MPTFETLRELSKAIKYLKEKGYEVTKDTSCVIGGRQAYHVRGGGMIYHCADYRVLELASSF